MAVVVPFKRVARNAIFFKRNSLRHQIESRGFANKVGNDRRKYRCETNARNIRDTLDLIHKERGVKKVQMRLKTENLAFHRHDHDALCL